MADKESNVRELKGHPSIKYEHPALQRDDGQRYGRGYVRFLQAVYVDMGRNKILIANSGQVVEEGNLAFVIKNSDKVTTSRGYRGYRG